MSKKIMVEVPMNRVEGDLEIRVQIQDGIVIDAWSSGIMYRGFENLLVGRAPLDGLVITPRICGICGTAHLLAASKALEMIFGVMPPPAAVRLRNVALMIEKIQSDIRHGFLMFATDFVNPAYQRLDLFNDAVRRYAPLKGETTVESIKQTKRLLEIIAIIGGQWPHSSYMIPGGITAMPSSGDILQCSYLISHFKNWYEKRVLGCSIDRWQEVCSLSDLSNWLDESQSHYNSELGFFIRFAREIGLDKYGEGYTNFISYGAMDLIGEDVGSIPDNQKHLFAAGFAEKGQLRDFSQEDIIEYVDHSWFEDHSGQHPLKGMTLPYASGHESKKYSWAKAPRYSDLPGETGPLAQMVISQNALFKDIIIKQGISVFLREFARLIRTAHLIPFIELLLSQTVENEPHYTPAEEIPNGSGFGLVEATRGSLGHWVVIQDGKIERYQVITPTAWNGSPRDRKGNRGPWEQALIGTRVKDVKNPVELGHVIRSFDACLFCTVHTIDLT